MYLHELAPAPGSRKARVRVGRGLGSGLGKTSGKGSRYTCVCRSAVSITSSASIILKSMWMY